MSKLESRFDKKINRKGTFSTQWDYIEDRFGRNDLLPFTISDTDFEVPNEVKQRLISRIEHGVFGYTRWNHEIFKSSVAEWFKKRHKTIVTLDHIAYTPTVMYGVAKMIQLLSEENDSIIIQTPAYDAFYKTITSSKRTILENPLIFEDNKYSIDFNHLEELLKLEQSKILLLCSPHNPTGRVWSKEELTKIVQLCKKYDIYILSDEIHMDILRKGKKHLPIINFDYPNIVVISSGTKTFNFPGLLFSYMIIPDRELRDKFIWLLKNEDALSSPSITGLEATIVAYDQCDYWVDELNNYVDNNYSFVSNFLKDNLPEITVTDSEATYLMWLDISQLPYDMQSIQEKLINIGNLAIMDGSIYGGNGNNFLRLNIGCPRSKLVDCLYNMKLALK